MYDDFFQLPLIKLGLEQRFIKCEGDFLLYTHQGVKKNLNNPEEKIRAQVFIKLVLEKEYPTQNIAIEVSVKQGSKDKNKTRADIVVYKTKTHKKAYIVIECKKQAQRDLREAKEQAISYANSLRADYAQATNGSESITLYCKEDGNDLIDDIPKFGGDAPLWKYLRASKNNNIKPINTNELERLLEKIHNYLWNGGKRNPAEAFSEFSKIIFIKIMDEKIAEYDPDYDKPYYEFQKNRDEDKFSLEKRIKELYNRYKEKDKNVFNNALILDADELKFLVENLESVNLHKTDLDIKGRVFQKFFADFFKGTAGQYFTPLNIVRFIIDCFEIKKDDTILDPSCGSGGFLLRALQYMQEKSKSLKGKDKQERFWHEFAEKKLYGIEINSNISQTAKMNMIIHDDGHTNIITVDGLDSFENFIKKNNHFQKDSFDFIFTNPPFGSNIPFTKSYFENYELSKGELNFIDRLLDNKSAKNLSAQKSEILFLERYYQFLKEKGIVACILPDGILSNSSMQHIRNYLLEKFYLLASFSLPQHTFSNYGAGVKSSVLIMQKKTHKDYKKFIDEKEKIYLELVDTKGAEILALRKELKEKLEPLIKDLKALAKELIKRENPLKKETNKKQKGQEKDYSNLSLGQINKKISKLQNEIQALKEHYKFKEEKIRGIIQNEAKEAIDKLENYEIFMAIIENIGYDATGKDICRYEDSDLSLVAKKFKEFRIKLNNG